MTTLLIAEKPSVARDLARFLGISGQGDGFIRCKDNTVCTWCVGHILEQAQPHVYDERYKQWRGEDLPIIPQEWILLPIQRTEKQLTIIKNLLTNATEVINAGDPEREGQLIVDEVLDYLNYTGPAKRLWISALDERTIQKGFSKLRDNSEFLNIKNAAICRANADWLVGLNVTRGLTIAARTRGTVLSAGRVQTPTLSLVVGRDREIEHFVKKPFWQLKATVRHEKGEFIATWEPGELSRGVDHEGRLVDESAADELIGRLSGSRAEVADCRKSLKKKTPPLPFMLSDLQKKAEDKFGYPPKKTLDIGQGLYEKKKCLTYMRTECRYLPDEMHEDAPRTIATLVQLGMKGAKEANPTLRSPAWNTKKQGAEAHHGIIPTEVVPRDLSEEERNIYNLVATRFLKQFFPNYQYYSTNILLNAQEERWRAKGITVKEPGWMVLNEQQTKDRPLPEVKKGDAALLESINKEQKATKPPSRFTEATLQVAMTEVHKYVEDPVIKARLKENSGIGTPATRTNIISELQKREYLQKKGKALISTDRGREIIDKMHPTLKSPGMTAIWEDALDRVCEGELTKDAFLTELTRRMGKMVEYALATQFSELITGKRYSCSCGGDLIRMESKKAKGKFFWFCSKGRENNCVPRSDYQGAPGAAFAERPTSGPPCPACGEGFLMRLESNRRPGFYFWACSTGKEKACPLLLDDNGQPGKPMVDPDAPKAPCPYKGCKEQVTRIQSAKNPNFFYWKCVNKEHPLFHDDKGKPGKKMEFKK
ncbi:DNA topoisomerase 3 [Desulfogranum mediterraneum]|uniref:DNA topoisomerase 3 n=1 Tax=Desulfogranum mediterraneum TaxID=160661 RepID=UPI000411A7B8|nr:DNA topoisomerase 3 [Desulfogranum mediterraneum]